MSKSMLPLEQEPDLRELIARALEEDVGSGDATSLALVPDDATASAALVTRQDVIVAGMRVAAEVFRAVDANVKVDILVPDGEGAAAGRAPACR